MSDISKINPNGTEYNLKDATARNAIQSSKTIKSSVVTVTDAAPINAEDITVDITPQQDLHGYGRPWAGGAGKNKYSTNLLPKSNNGITVELTGIGEIWVHGTPISASGYEAFIVGDIPSSLIGKQVVLSTDVKISGIGFAASDGAINLTMNDTVLSRSAVYNPNDNKIFVNVRNTIGAINQKFKVQFEEGSTRTSFAPYTNICPIEGRTGAELDRVGKNWLPMTVAGIKAANTGGTWSGNSYTTNGVTFTINTDDAENVISISSNNGGNDLLKLIFTLPAGSYILSSGFTETMYSNDTYLRIGTTVIARGTSGAFTLTESTELNWNFRVSHTAVVCTPMIRLATETDSTYEPYQGISRTASFGETVYGGKWHVTEGGTDKTHANIANYNGETINEPWLSSMDEYVAGATPTTGAQVVYPLTTPTTISTPKQNVPMLQGINTVSADCGDTQLKYQPDNVVGELKGEIEDNIIYEDYKWTTESSRTYSAGTPGTYGCSSWRDVKKEGYDVIGVTFVENRRFGDCILTLYYIPSTSHVEVIIFRATSSSVTIADEDITYRVAYKKH